ncbi:MAG: 50S ribosomal protein L11 methyltransferase [Fimbriimonadaceae bacterium]|nr:50S ribosomal protein L11 methyltransferase [Fimbriimonadaceae bacterium]
MNPTWVLVRARYADVPPDWSPRIDVFIEHGAPSVLEEEGALVAYFPEVAGIEEATARLSKALQADGATVEIGRLVEQDWTANFRDHFKPRRIGKRFVVRPTWEAFDAGPDDVELVLDPGQAFGTGDHATTRMCLELIEDVLAEGASFLDVGCGSGILSIAARKLGADPVVGIDVDPLSVEVARENAERNGVAATWVAGNGFDAVDRTYDVVVSNIISAVLIRVAPDAAEAVRPGGVWIVSGVIRDNWPDVRAAAERAGFALEKRLEELEWVAATFRR